MTEVSVYGASPFDAIRHTDPSGSDCWSARELMPLLGYERWERFEDTIDRARVACANSGLPAQDHFRGAAKMVSIGSGAQRNVVDVHMTRYGSYLVAMNGDPRKPEIARAQTYFAIRTREAEAQVSANVRAAPQQTQAVSRRELAMMVIEAEDRAAEAEKQLALAAPKVAYVDQFADVAQDSTTVRMLATQLSITEPKLRDFLREQGVLSRRTVADYINGDGKRRVEYEWQARAGFYDWFITKDQPLAPRMYNGQLRSTLYVTPLGKVGIADLLAKHRGGAA